MSNAQILINGEEKNLIELNHEILVLSKIQTILMKNEGWYKPIEAGLIDKIGKQLSKIKEKIDLKNAQYKKLLEQISNIEHPVLYVNSSTDKPIASTATDADGKFELKTKESDGAFLLAHTKSDYWMVSINKLNNGKINLTEDNLYDSGCDTCFLKYSKNQDYSEKIKSAMKSSDLASKYDIFSKEIDKPITDDLLDKVKPLEKLANHLGNEIGAVMIEKSRSNWVGLGAAQQQYKVQMREIKLQEDFIKARELHKEYSNLLLERVIKLEKRI